MLFITILSLFDYVRDCLWSSKLILKDLGVKGHHACNILSYFNNNKYIERKRMRQRKCGKMLTFYISRWRIYGDDFFQLFCRSEVIS